MQETINTPAVADFNTIIFPVLILFCLVLILLNKYINKQLQAARKEISYLKKQLTPPAITNVTVAEKGSFIVFAIILVIANILIWIIIFNS